MPIPEAMKSLMRLVSENEPDILRSYKLERAMKERLKSPGRFVSKVIGKGDTELLNNGREVVLRVCTPLEYNGSKTAILFFHGGGWVTESVDTYTDVCINLANYTKCKVVAADYSLAPEFPFPCALEDCYAAAKKLITDPDFLDLDADGRTFCLSGLDT